MTSTDEQTTDPTTRRTTSRSAGPTTWETTWLTANVRPAGSFGREDVGRLRALLDALSASASLVVLDLQAASLRSGRAAEVIDVAAAELERRGGCLLCVNADDEARRRLGGCRHAVVVAAGEPLPVG
ncbi:hypothetical protein GXP71_18820 [Cellulomonas sp. H30R-01]|uniref:hypothetical protein n=1 Tax=Cellulomonas sp. H30R-01 TaxID=2704467 RepID=UPI00138D7663|nr:hypothetical protein [Cellulomonas sp. H30R-01]QHT57936.1 hypothetical protein GXP71_18820 [Cellulomonas sp. H30R-01]